MSRRKPWPRVLTAWLLFAGFAGTVLFLGSSPFGAAATRSFVRPILLWLFPNATPVELWQLNLTVRKLAHLTEYGTLSVLAFHAVFVSLETLMARVAALSLLLVLAVSATDEFHQSFLPTRTGSPWDVALDLSGAVLALGLVLVWRRLDGSVTGSSPEAP